MRRIQELSSDARMETFKAFSPEKKRFMLERMVPFRSKSRPLGISDFLYLREHLALNDPAALQVLTREFDHISDYNKGLNFEADLLNSALAWPSPETLRLVIPHTFSNEPYRFRGPSDAWSEPLSFMATGTAFALISQSESLPDPVRRWAPSVKKDQSKLLSLLQRKSEQRKDYDRVWMSSLGLRPAERERDVLQKWWKANEAAIVAKRYAEVVPGEQFAAPSGFLPGIADILKTLDWK